MNKNPERRRLYEFQKRKIAAAGGWKCRKCRTLLSFVFQIDHIIPLHSPYWHQFENPTEMANSEKNLQALCPNCHALKSMHETEIRLLASQKPLPTPFLLASSTYHCKICNRYMSTYFKNHHHHHHYIDENMSEGKERNYPCIIDDI